MEYAVMQWVDAQRYKPECVGLEFRWGLGDFSFMQTLTEMSTGDLPWDGKRLEFRADNLTTFICRLKIRRISTFCSLRSISELVYG
jgi:hypothetical protein